MKTATLQHKNDEMTTCKTTGAVITFEEMEYRDGKRNDIVRRMQLQLGKTKKQVLALFHFYNSLAHRKKS